MQYTQVLHFKTSFKLSLLLLVTIADFLFYGQRAGWTLGLFGSCLLLAGFLHNQKQILRNKGVVITFSVALGLTLALVNRPDTFTISSFVYSLFSLAVLMRNAHVKDARAWLSSTLLHMFIAIGRFCRDSVIITRIQKRIRRMRNNSKMPFVKRWLMPLMLSALFILLFAEANPIISHWLAVFEWINWAVIAEYLSLPRMLFWLVAASFCWAIVRPYCKVNRLPAAPMSVTKPRPLFALLFNEQSTLTALMLFNGLFLIQNLLDVAFLWSGAALPQGLTHAEYAHQGAYPLVATALLAALFVLIALKPGSTTEQQPRIRALVYAWVGQNVFMVISSIIRLFGYVGEFSLTYLRIKAFIWMGLVGVGLVLIVSRIYCRKSNLWLINANALALSATLYLCCFINFSGIIADYNVRHCYEVTGEGAHLDIAYLMREVGTESLPALIWYSNQPNAKLRTDIIPDLQMQVKQALKDWRQWTIQNYRLGAYTAQD